jgi:hypothetical protein
VLARELSAARGAPGNVFYLKQVGRRTGGAGGGGTLMRHG